MLSYDPYCCHGCFAAVKSTLCCTSILSSFAVCVFFLFLCFPRYAFLEFASEAVAEKNYKLLENAVIREDKLAIDYVGSKSKFQRSKERTESGLYWFLISLIWFYESGLLLVYKCGLY